MHTPRERIPPPPQSLDLTLSTLGCVRITAVASRPDLADSAATSQLFCLGSGAPRPQCPAPNAVVCVPGDCSSHYVTCDANNRSSLVVQQAPPPLLCYGGALRWDAPCKNSR